MAAAEPPPGIYRCAAGRLVAAAAAEQQPAKHTAAAAAAAAADAPAGPDEEADGGNDADADSTSSGGALQRLADPLPAAAGLRLRKGQAKQATQAAAPAPASPSPSPSGRSTGTAALALPSPPSCTSVPAAAAPAGGRPAAGLTRRYAALQATFCFSAAWHIAIFWYNTHVVCYRWVAFFCLQAPILTAERALVARCRAAGLQLPRWAAVLATNGALILVANPLFFGPADDYGFAQRCLANFHARYAALEGWLAGLAGR
jgi:hypothetical protein